MNIQKPSMRLKEERQKNEPSFCSESPANYRLCPAKASRLRPSRTGCTGHFSYPSSDKIELIHRLELLDSRRRIQVSLDSPSFAQSILAHGKFYVLTPPVVQLASTYFVTKQ